MALTRKFTASDGIHWQVYELSDDTAARDRRWLYFFSRGVTKSLSPYPDDWAVMDWPGLARLCQRARPPARCDATRPLTALGQGAEV